MKDPIIVSSTDGVGTKIEIANTFKKYNTIGIDLVAMCVNDLIVQGAKPIFFLDYIAINKIKLKQTKKILDGKFKSSNRVVLEEFLKGEELSYFVVVDKNSYCFFGSAQDHKRVGEGDVGPNTGGMGAYSPAPLLTNELEDKIKKKIIEPTLLAMKKLGHPYTGFLYAGLMINENEPYLIEYNIRMGDPECQVLMMRLQTDLLEIIDRATKNKIRSLKIKWKNKY